MDDLELVVLEPNSPEAWVVMSATTSALIKVVIDAGLIDVVSFLELRTKYVKQSLDIMEKLAKQRAERN